MLRLGTLASRVAARSPIVRRAMSTATEAKSSVKDSLGDIMKLGSLLESGLAGGVLGGLVGLGAHGGAVTMPALRSAAGFSSVIANGTSSAATVAIGIAGVLAFATSGGGYFGVVDFLSAVAGGEYTPNDIIAFFRGSGVVGKVDFYAAGVVGLGALMGARLGAPIIARCNPLFLQRMFGVFQMALAPMVPLKGYAERRKAEEDKLTRKASIADWGNTYTKTYQQFARVAELLTAGLAAGSAFTMLGVGGGVVIAPVLCLLTNMDHATVLGTTLAAMLPASLLGCAKHMHGGTMSMGAALPLSFAAAFGAFFGAKLACDASDETLQIGFGVLVFALGSRRLLNPTM